ncbi:hypothetical protein ARMGADRAFT_1096470 [Armillaria gallica]|uniref:Uncharacterized protein n=1 Tax=Armillaria gallica TaxID=47427 RepID=A0A2H3E9Z8_ARMGA|nr:hypothetical protein ARMGADRAFT_1096470 [Armillaria gallica]
MFWQPLNRSGASGSHTTGTSMISKAMEQREGRQDGQWGRRARVKSSGSIPVQGFKLVIFASNVVGKLKHSSRHLTPTLPHLIPSIKNMTMATIVVWSMPESQAEAHIQDYPFLVKNTQVVFDGQLLPGIFGGDALSIHRVDQDTGGVVVVCPDTFVVQKKCKIQQPLDLVGSKPRLAIHGVMVPWLKFHSMMLGIDASRIGRDVRGERIRWNVLENEGRQVYGDYPGFEKLERKRGLAESEDVYSDESEVEEEEDEVNNSDISSEASLEEDDEDSNDSDTDSSA